MELRIRHPCRWCGTSRG